MREFFGVNTAVGQNFDNPDDIQPLVGWIREYSKWHLFEPSNNDYRFTNVRDSINFDSLYQHISDLGINTLLVIMKSPKWISSNPSGDYDDYVPSGNTSGLKPEHYQEAAEFYFQLAARYGSKKVSSDKLQTDDKKSGLNIVGSIGVLSEADGAFEWGNRIEWEQYAALLNAVYDGNNGKMGSGYGIKDADPDLPVSVSGLAFNLKSLIRLKEFAGRNPYDVINVHFYAFRYARPTHRVAVPPEWSSLASDMKEIVEWRDNEAPGRPVWLTEIGWDTQDYATEQVSEEEAASYLIRSFLLAKEAGVDKAFWFYYRDLDNFERKGTFSTSGLFKNETIPYGGKTNLSPKLTYWYFGTMTNKIGNLQYTKNLSDSITYHYSFASPDQTKIVHVLWYCPTYYYEWRQLVNYPQSIGSQLKIPKSAKNLKITRPVEGSFNGIPASGKMEGNTLLLSLTGTPVFVEYSLE